MSNNFNSEDDKPSVVATGGGLGFSGLLTIVFIVLKLCNVINWNWFWVLSPVIFSAALWIVLFVIVMIIALVNMKND